MRISNGMNSREKLIAILGVSEEVLLKFEKEIGQYTNAGNVMDRIQSKAEENVVNILTKINSGKNETAEDVRGILRKIIVRQEKNLLEYLKTIPGDDEFAQSANLSKKLAKVDKGYFLKKSFIAKIFSSHEPKNLLSYLGYTSVSELLEKEDDLTEAFSALRFVESDEWMHKTFEIAYNNFSSEDFEERAIEIKVLGPKWKDIAKKFIAKKHHNVSHLKEFGVIFLNPISEDIPGKFLRDFALLLHYFHEVVFYSKLFKKYIVEDNFNERFKALLRGDVKSLDSLKKGEWLIVQRYLIKENPNDPRLLHPRINPESLHWARGERDLTVISELSDGKVDLSLWYDLDWVGEVFKNREGKDEVVSFDLEDNAMSLVSFMEGKQEVFTYHQREALWNRIFMEYLGGEEKLEELLIENFDKGVIKLT